MKTFGMYEDVDGLKPCVKKSVTYAKRMNEPFKVNSMEGVVEGKAGDYLMKGVDGELYICDAAIFEKTYQFK